MKKYIGICTSFLLLLCLLSQIAYASEENIEGTIDFSGMSEEENLNQPVCIYFYNPANPSVYHTDPACQAYGDRYIPFIKITGSYPLFPFMHPCLECTGATNVTASSTHPSLWSMDEKAENMPDTYSVPTDQEASLFQVVQSAVKAVIKNGDDPSQYACYVNHLRSAEDNGCYIVFFSRPYCTTDGSVFQNVKYEIVCSSISGEVLSCDALPQTDECTY